MSSASLAGMSSYPEWSQMADMSMDNDIENELSRSADDMSSNGVVRSDSMSNLAQLSPSSQSSHPVHEKIGEATANISDAEKDLLEE